MRTTSPRNVPVALPPSAEYLPTLTALRGFAALWVMLFHLDVITFYRELGVLIPHTATGLIAKGYLWVDFFFVLSGFIIQHTYGPSFESTFTRANFWPYIKARFWRIYPLHLFTLALLLCFVVTLPILTTNVVDSSWDTYFEWKALVSNILLTNSMNQHSYLSWNIVSWSIGAEWWTYIVGIVVVVILRRAGKGLAIISIMAGIILLTLLIFLHPGNSLDITYDFGFLRCLFGFTIGVATHTLFRLNFLRGLLRKDLGFALIFLGLVALMHWRGNDLLSVPLFALLVLAGAFNRRVIAKIMSSKVPQYLGRISYSIYLMHGVWFMVFWFLLPQISRALSIQTLSISQQLVYMTTFASLTLVSSAFSYRYIEVPYRKGLTRNNLKTALKTKPTTS